MTVVLVWRLGYTRELKGVFVNKSTALAWIAEQLSPEHFRVETWEVDGSKEVQA